MASLETLNPNFNHHRRLSRLPQDIINTIFSKFSVKDILQLRSVCKSWLSLVSSPRFVKTHEMIMYNIFLRLPVKTLLILKSVCKFWLSVISSRDFIKTHLTVSTNDPYKPRHGLLTISACIEDRYFGPSERNLWTCSLHSLLDEPFTRTLTLCNEDLRPESIVGCCNGLVLVKEWLDTHLFLWNPSTRKSRTLPQLDIDEIYDGLSGYVFCYDEWNDDFKVFAISDFQVFAISPGQFFKHKVSVYSLKSDSRRRIGDFPYGGGYNGHFAVGAIHWIPFTGEVDIVSLDIKTETYREVLLPGIGEGDWGWKLGTFGESLAVLCKFENTGRFDLWVTNDCAVEVSWTKLFTIPYIDGLREDSKLYPICMSVNGDIMLQLDSVVLLHNSKDNTFKHLLTDPHYSDLNVYTYIESLVSLHL